MEKGSLSVGYIPVNKFTLSVADVADLKVVEVSGIEQELETVELPDKTVVTSGRLGVTEFTIKIPAHETTAMGAMDVWWKMCYGVNATSGYKKLATLLLLDTFGATKSSWSITGMFPTKRALPELNAASEGEMAMAEWTFKADDIKKI